MLNFKNMETSTLTIHLPKDISVELAKKAKSSGKNVAEYVEDLVSKQVKRPSLDNILSPIRDGFEKSGMSEAELEQLIDREVKAVRAERRSRRNG